LHDTERHDTTALADFKLNCNGQVSHPSLRWYLPLCRSAVACGFSSRVSCVVCRMCVVCRVSCVLGCCVR
jgi:hypothetical protein